MSEPEYVHALDALRALRDKRRGVVPGHRGNLESFTPDSRAPDPDDPFDGPKLITDPAAYVETVMSRALDELAAMGERSGRNAAAHALGRTVGRLEAGKLPVNTGDALERTVAACDTNCLVDEDGLKSVRDSIRSGYSWGKQHPVEWQLAPCAVTGPTTADYVKAVEAFAQDAAALTGPPVTAETLLQAELQAQRIRREARRLLDAEEQAAHLKAAGPGYTWGEFVAFEFPDIPWLIDDLMPRGGNATLTAPFKTGKTTTIGELIVALRTGTPFLGQFTTALGPDEVIAAWDYEMTPQLHQEWSRKLDSHFTTSQRERVYLRHLRGAGLKLDSERGIDEAVRWLSERNVKVWILDPFARAYLGDENDNGAVTRWTDTLDVIKERAGVHSLVMPVHTGRREAMPGGERARGATRLDDWPDVRWLLAKDDEGQRYFRASGRDVEVDEIGLKLRDDRRLVVDGGGRKDTESRRGFDAAYRELPLYGDDVPGMSLSALATEIGQNHNATKKIVAAMRKTVPPLIKVVERQRGAQTEMKLWKLRHFDDAGQPTGPPDRTGPFD